MLATQFGARRAPGTLAVMTPARTRSSCDADCACAPPAQYVGRTHRQLRGTGNQNRACQTQWPNEATQHPSTHQPTPANACQRTNTGTLGQDNQHPGKKCIWMGGGHRHVSICCKRVACARPSFAARRSRHTFAVSVCAAQMRLGTRQHKSRPTTNAVHLSACTAHR